MLTCVRRAQVRDQSHDRVRRAGLQRLSSVKARPESRGRGLPAKARRQRGAQPA